MKIVVEWNDYTMTEDVAASLSNHALDRAIERSGEPIMQLRSEVEALVNQAESSLIDLSKQYKTFLLKGKKGLAVVGTLIKNGIDFIFKVITLHRKKNFVPNNPNDKVIDLSEDAIEGGLADNINIASFNKEQLIKGIKVEFEHTNDVAIAAEIASDHLAEDPTYYDKLDQMENSNDETVIQGEKDSKEEVFIIRRDLEASIAGLEDLALKLPFTMNDKREIIESVLQTLYSLHGELAIDKSVLPLPSDVIPYAQKFAMTEGTEEDKNLAYAKRFINQQFFKTPSNIKLIVAKNQGEDIERELDRAERDTTSLELTPEWEFVTEDLTNGDKVIVWISLEEEYDVEYNHSPGDYDTPDYSGLEETLVSKRWTEVLVEGSEVTPDLELKTMLDKIFNYPK